MWIWEFQLRELGFRRKNDVYWICERGCGLADGDHLSLFLWTREAQDSSPSAFELTEFHVTFLIGSQNVHFYYHEIGDNLWEPGGHTSGMELEGLGCDPPGLIAEADEIARLFVKTLDGRWLDRA